MSEPRSPKRQPATSTRRIPSFHLLRAFETAAQESSFAKAAQLLHLTPSAISHQIKELEDHLGQELFVRQHRRISLTPVGQTLAARLTGVFDSIAAACDEVSGTSRRSVLTLHSAPSFATKWLAPRLRLLAEVHPEFSITITSTAEPVDLMQDRQTDVAISYGAAIRREGLWVRSLGTEEIAPMCSPRARLTVQEGRELLYQLPLISSPLSRIAWETWFHEHGLPMPNGRRMSLDRASLGISAAADGIGIVLESVRLAEPELSSGALVRLDAAPSPSRWVETHFLSVRQSDLDAPKVAAFIAWLLPLVNVDIDHGAAPTVPIL